MVQVNQEVWVQQSETKPKALMLVFLGELLLKSTKPRKGLDLESGVSQQRQKRSSVRAGVPAGKGRHQSSPSPSVRARRRRQVQLHQLCQQRHTRQNDDFCFGERNQLRQQFHQEGRKTFSSASHPDTQRCNVRVLNRAEDTRLGSGPRVSEMTQHVGWWRGFVQLEVTRRARINKTNLFLDPESDPDRIDCFSSTCQVS